MLRDSPVHSCPLSTGHGDRTLHELHNPDIPRASDTNSAAVLTTVPGSLPLR
jgi:hypothetical protein